MNTGLNHKERLIILYECQVLFKTLKEIKDYWVQTSIDGLKFDADLIWSDFEDEYIYLQKILTSEKDIQAYRKILDEIIRGVIHSILVMIDGGDELTDEFNVDLIDYKTKKSLKYNNNLHELFFEYLINEEE